MNNNSLQLKTGLTTQALLASVRGLKKQPVPASGAADRPDRSWVWRHAAAVLHVYNPAVLKPLGEGDPALGVETLAPDSTLAIGWRNENCRTLRTEIRAAALAELETRERMRGALAANPDREMTSVQILFEAWLDGRLDLDQLSYGDLQDARQLYDWGLEPLGGLPSRQAFDQRRARRAGVALFEHLVDKSFVGRQAELQRLRDFVGVVEPSVWAQIRAFVDRGPRPPLVLWGKGGVGKTALLGRFLLEHVESRAIGWFPFVYVAFDSETVDVRQPWTLLAAAVEQLAAQMMPAGADAVSPRIVAAFRKFREALVRFRSERASVTKRASSTVSQAARGRGSLATEATLSAGFAELLSVVASFSAADQNARDVPVVIVLDTFEEVLYRADEDLIGLWRMLGAVQEGFPALRVLIAGRAEPRPFQIGGRRPSSFQLDDLAEADALVVLERLGVADPAARLAIVQQVGCSPLTLRLAARAAQEEAIQSSGFSGIGTRGWFGRRLAGDVIRGELYRRILDHIHDENVRALAHPGMALRKVTPKLILRVLAPVCFPEPVDSVRAEELFEALRREHALVRLDDDSSLRYREEVRTPMLSLLALDKPEQLAQLRERAVAFYADTRDPADRAEELYHRMMLEQSPAVLDSRWMPGVERYLGSAVDEIPVAQKVWLARHMSIQLPAEVYSQADVAAWEELIGGKALEISRYGSPEEVLHLLAERADRTPESPLYAIEMRALMSLGRFEQALALGQKAAAGWTMKNPGRLCEVFWLAAQAARQGGQPEQAAPLLLKLTEAARDLVSRLPEVQALTELVSLAPSERRVEFQTRLGGALEKLSEAEIDSERSLVRLACVRLGPSFPQTLRRILRYVVSDLLLQISEKQIDISSAAEQALLILQKSDPASWDRTLLHDPGGFAQGLFELVYQAPSSAVIEAILAIMAAERADLGAATLAGLDSYRESFELRAAPEALA